MEKNDAVDDLSVAFNGWLQPVAPQLVVWKCYADTDAHQTENNAVT